MILSQIAEVVGPLGWTDDPTILGPHLEERRGLFRGKTPVLLSPANVEQLAEIVRMCADAGIPMVPQGGNTGLCGGAVPNSNGKEILITLKRLNSIHEIDLASNTMTVEAGCVLSDLQTAAQEVDRLFPLSLASEGSCQIGGNLSTNAGGTAVLRYGNARDLVLGLQVVLPDGQIWDGLKKLRKDNTGYDLKHLFMGSEGTLGIITAAVLRLFPRPRSKVTAFIGMQTPADTLSLLDVVRAFCGDAITGFEVIPRIGLDFCLRHIPNTRDPLAKIYPWYCLVELHSGFSGNGLRDAAEEAFGRAFEDNIIEDATIAENETHALSLWKLRESLPEAELHEGGSIKHDVSIPIPNVPDFIQKASDAVEKAIPGVRIVAFGHLGDGNIHFNVGQPVGADKEEYLEKWHFINRIVHDIVDSYDGSISAEHGLGQLKRVEIQRYKSSLEIDIMQNIKAAIDPLGLMNPGKVV